MDTLHKHSHVKLNDKKPQVLLSFIYSFLSNG